MAAGNRSVLVIVDSRDVALRQTADWGICAALDHFGVAWQVLDGGDYWALPPGYLAERAAIVIAHDRAAAWLRPQDAEAVCAAVRSGVGLLSFDRDTSAWPDALRCLAPATEGAGDGGICVGSVCFPPARHAVTVGHEAGETIELLKPARAVRVGCQAADAVAVVSGEGFPLVVCGQRDTGRCVFFAVGNSLYDETVLGHTRGLDGLFWRSLVWVARKPFPMRCIPPYVSARMDDCHGTHTAFAYVTCLNRHGIRPNLGLFIDELGPTDWAAAAALFRTGGADFSMHAFRDDFYKASPRWRPYALLADKPDLSKGGRETRFEGLGMDHTSGRDLADETVRRNFARVDEAFARAGIRHSRIVNAHYGEISLNSLPHYLARGADLPCNNSVIGQLYGNQPLWRPRPYGLRAVNGRYGLIVDRLPQHPGFTSIAFSASHLGKTHMTGDILSGHTPFMGESAQLDAGAAIRRGIANVRAGLDSLAFGVIMTHEERIDAMAIEDWERIVDGILAGLGELEAIPAAREQVSVVCRRLFATRLGFAEATPRGLVCEITGSSDGPSPLTLWSDGPEGPVARRVEVPAVNGFLRVTV
jgi:hypothetical protein